MIVGEFTNGAGQSVVIESRDDGYYAVVDGRVTQERLTPDEIVRYLSMAAHNPYREVWSATFKCPRGPSRPGTVSDDNGVVALLSSEDGGQAVILEVSREQEGIDGGMFVRVQSWAEGGTDQTHGQIEQLYNERVRVSVEIYQD